ncbi:f-box domain-containing protein [Citrus sinensis]|uniref:F-box domain-containing protein n=1 Tax=Citrus sinensis TaxID=2711 RepID=A0ACB8JDA8_CITSI|nr:f-box domain-containing protein [Citrus sinensis]
MTENPLDLPPECWELIFNSLNDQSHFESLSLVSHRFLSITNYLRNSLKLTDPSTPFLPHLFNRFQNLKKIDLSEFQGDPNSILYLISRSGLDLESLNISNLKSFPFMGLKELGTKMKNLKELNCSKNFSFRDSDLIAVAETCEFLEVLDISYPENDSSFLPQGFQNIQSFSFYITDSGIEALSMKLKRLKRINLSEEGIGEILKSCCEIKCLEIKRCRAVFDLGIDLELPKLEVLQASGSALNDHALKMIANTCSRILHLDLDNCLNVTTSGVKEVVEHCRTLREINLRWCDEVNVDIVAWMVFSRPSLRKIIPPCGFAPTESQKNFFLRHGCLVCKG